MLYNLLLTLCSRHITQIYFVIDLEHTYTKNKNPVPIYPFDIQFHLSTSHILHWSNYLKPDDNVNSTCHRSFAA